MLVSRSSCKHNNIIIIVIAECKFQYCISVQIDDPQAMARER